MLGALGDGLVIFSCKRGTGEPKMCNVLSISLIVIGEVLILFEEMMCL